jgi:hypothetical protein
MESSRQYVSASVSIDGCTYVRAGIHLKGHGSFRSLHDKPSLTVDFGRFEPQQRACGLRKLHLNNSVEDGSLLREWIGSRLFRSAGVPAPRVTHALVELNGRRLGIYVLKEAFAKEFLAQYFSRSDGQLYEEFDGEVPSGEGRPSDPALERLAEAAREPDLKVRWQRLRNALDRDRFVAFMAMEVVTCHWDGYSLARNNFRVYHDPGTDRLVFLPSGMDQLLGNPALTWQPHMAGLVARAVMETPEGRAQFRAAVERLVNQELNPARVAQELDGALSRVCAELEPRAAAVVRDEAARLKAQIAQRYTHLRQELRQPGPELLDPGADALVLSDWHRNSASEPACLEERLVPDGTQALRIAAGPLTGDSWRKALRLPPGRYRFEALGRVQDVAALPFGKHHGARLRVAGRTAESRALLGSGSWERLEVCFDVGVCETEVELVCELRARGGTVWFAKDSLRLSRVERQPTTGGTDTAFNSHSRITRIQPGAGRL